MARVKELYNNGITDEFIPPFTVVDDDGDAGCADPRQRCGDLLQLPRRPRAADYARAGANSQGLTANGGLDLPKAAELDAEIPRSMVPPRIFTTSA